MSLTNNLNIDFSQGVTSFFSISTSVGSVGIYQWFPGAPLLNGSKKIQIYFFTETLDSF